MKHRFHILWAYFTMGMTTILYFLLLKKRTGATLIEMNTECVYTLEAMRDLPEHEITDCFTNS